MTLRHDTVKEAQGKWYGILTSLGIDQNYLRNKHGPCPMCEGRDRFRFDDKEGKGTWFCNQCGAGNGIQLLMGVTGWDFKTAAAKVDSLLGVVEPTKSQPKRDALPYLRRVAGELVTVEGINPVRLYLRSRGIRDFPTEALRLHPALPYFDENRQLVGKFPAMVARISDVNGRALTYHVTYLTSDGRKAPVECVKKVLPSNASITGGAIRLSPVAAHLALAEGIETALAVRQLYSVPCWAAVNANLMEKFEVPEGVERLTIYADNDSSFTGQKAAFVLANRLHKKFRVAVEVAPAVDSDFADLLKPRSEQRSYS